MTTNSALAPPRDGIRRGQPRGCLVRPLGVSANTPCGNTQASSPSDTGARSRSSCESRCVAPSAGTGHPLLHRAGGRRPPSLSLVLKCEREPGTSVIPVCKQRAKGGPLREQGSVELITRFHRRVGRTATLDDIVSLGSARLGLHVLEGNDPATVEHTTISQADQPSICYSGVDSPGRASRGFNQARHGTR